MYLSANKFYFMVSRVYRNTFQKNTRGSPISQNYEKFNLLFTMTLGSILENGIDIVLFKWLQIF